MTDEEDPIIYNPHFAKITFPSDQITIGQIRKRQPRIMLSAEDANEEWGSLSVQHIVQFELEVAEIAWAKAIGQEMKPHYLDRGELLEEMNLQYERYGISSGPKQTEEIVRRFEQEISDIAKKTVGKGR